MIHRHPIQLVLLALLPCALLTPARAQHIDSPYEITISTPRLAIFPQQDVDVTVTVTNASDKAGPSLSRELLVGSKSFLCANARGLDAGSQWKGQWARIVGETRSGTIGALLPGESFTTRATIKIPESVSEEEQFSLYLEWYGSSGALEGLRSNQLIFQIQQGDKPIATIDTGMGTIVLELWPDKAPNHVANMIDLAQKGFYDNRIFHRVIRNFMIQGGCPEGTGSGGPGYTIPDEFNDTPFKKGILGMAKTDAPNSAGSQFFVMVADNPSLNEKYTAFGRVLEGQEVADKISNTPTQGDRPLTEVKLKGVRVALPKTYVKPEIKKS